MECTPVNPCTHPSMGNCHQHATCYYTSPGQNTCACNEGYIGDGYDCSLTNSCTGLCHPQATCEDIEGVPHCICGNGYHGDGIVCYSNIAIEIASNSILINFNNLLMVSLKQLFIWLLTQTIVSITDTDQFFDY
ncbi:stabilin-2-like [Anneissia japonica]|uniref:stabilin-2-like n=1 Tax=Anneissia japonica TaxID=1529436 RepID=UPI0014257134|nr:stabilin-2-like [Anneissia japonica]